MNTALCMGALCSLEKSIDKRLCRLKWAHIIRTMNSDFIENILHGELLKRCFKSTVKDIIAILIKPIHQLLLVLLIFAHTCSYICCLMFM